MYPPHLVVKEGMSVYIEIYQEIVSKSIKKSDFRKIWLFKSIRKSHFRDSQTFKSITISKISKVRHLGIAFQKYMLTPSGFLRSIRVKQAF